MHGANTHETVSQSRMNSQEYQVVFMTSRSVFIVSHDTRRESNLI